MVCELYINKTVTYLSYVLRFIPILCAWCFTKLQGSVKRMW